jgi:hypothetical protein
MSVGQKPDGRWYVKYYVDGKQKWEYFGRGIKAEHLARQWDATLKAKKQIRPYHRHPGRVEAITLAELANAYVNAKQGENPKTSIVNLLYKLSAVILPELGGIPAIA